MGTESFFSIKDLGLICPELTLSLAAFTLIFVDMFIPKEKKHWIGYLSLYSLILTLATVFIRWGGGEYGFAGMIIADAYSSFFKMIFLVAGILTVLISINYLKIEKMFLGEYYIIILFAIIGMMFMASGTDLISIYIALELMALSVYFLAGSMKRNLKSNEGAMKYFLLGIFSSAIFLYGISLIYGVTAATNLNKIAAYLGEYPNILENYALLMGMILMVVGLCFKIAAVPFHVWAPDAYEGAPTSITAFMSVGPKAAAFAIFVRIFIFAMPALHEKWQTLLWVVSALTMTAGNLIAVSQTNVKRLLAYSSIAHAGYLLLGLVAYNEYGLRGILIYLLIYAFMNIGAFAMVIILRRKDIVGDRIEDFSGLAKKSPAAAALMLIFMLSLAGIPPTAGFVGKFFLFASVIKAGFYWLAVIAVLNTAVSLYYYFRIVVTIYMGETLEDARLALSPAIITALALTGFFTLAIGIYPQPWSRLAASAIRIWFPLP
jgi:NADH-quinone oxidoreductase subunit N